MNDVVSQFNFGFYGKIPSAGDFVSRDISHHYLQYIDDWFSAGMVALSAGNQHWLDSYLTAPVWNFIISPGAWGEEYLYGAVMPSVDSVGRYFPFVAISRGESLINIDPIPVSYLSSLAYQLPVLLQGSFPPDTICHFLAENVKSEKSVPDVFAALDVLDSSEGGSCWWCLGRELSEPPFFVHHGPPNSELFKKLFLDV